MAASSVYKRWSKEPRVASVLPWLLRSAPIVYGSAATTIPPPDEAAGRALLMALIEGQRCR
jgi:hypothetical protein